MLSLDELAIFVVIAEHNSISAAARQLNIPKATLSRRLVEFEEKLGKTLFVRSTRKMTLTEDGSSLFQIAQPVIDDAMGLLSSINEPAETLAGSVVISATNAIGEYRLWPALQNFNQQYPQIKVELMLTESRVNLIQESIDIAVRMGALEDSDYLARPIFRVQRLVVCTPEFAARQGKINGLEQLSELPAIVQRRSLQSFVFANEQRVTFNWSLSCSNLNMLKSALLNHRGFGVLPDFMVNDELKNGTFIELLPDSRLPPAQASLVSPRRRFRSPAIQLVREHLLQEFAV